MNSRLFYDVHFVLSAGHTLHLRIFLDFAQLVIILPCFLINFVMLWLYCFLSAQLTEISQKIYFFISSTGR